MTSHFETILLLIVCLITQSLLFLVLVVRSKRDTRKVLRENQRLAQQFHEYFSRIELRMAQPFRQFSRAHQNVTWIIVFTYNRKEMLKETLLSLRKTEHSIHILVIDNGSTDGTKELLSDLLTSNIIQKVLFNRREDIPQWQKCFNLHQAFQLLASEKIDFIGWIDDDMTVTKPWKNVAITALDELASANVKMIALLNDSIQEEHHPTLSQVNVCGEIGSIKATINGQFVFFSVELLEIFGLPPIREGINDLGVEDWYYSRLLQASSSYCAAFDMSIHHGYSHSIREQLEHNT